MQTGERSKNSLIIYVQNNIIAELKDSSKVKGE